MTLTVTNVSNIHWTTRNQNQKYDIASDIDVAGTTRGVVVAFANHKGQSFPANPVLVRLGGVDMTLVRSIDTGGVRASIYEMVNATFDSSILISTNVSITSPEFSDNSACRIFLLDTSGLDVVRDSSANGNGALAAVGAPSQGSAVAITSVAYDANSAIPALSPAGTVDVDEWGANSRYSVAGLTTGVTGADNYGYANANAVNSAVLYSDVGGGGGGGGGSMAAIFPPNNY